LIKNKNQKNKTIKNLIDILKKIRKNIVLVKNGYKTTCSSYKEKYIKKIIK